MIFTEEEQSEIKKLTDKNDLLKRLWEEYKELVADGSKMLFSSFNKALKTIAERVDDGTLKSTDPWFAAVMEIGKSGEKLFNTSSKGKAEDGIKEEPSSKRGKIFEQHKGKALI